MAQSQSPLRTRGKSSNLAATIRQKLITNVELTSPVSQKLNRLSPDKNPALSPLKIDKNSTAVQTMNSMTDKKEDSPPLRPSREKIIGIYSFRSSETIPTEHSPIIKKPKVQITPFGSKDLSNNKIGLNSLNFPSAENKILLEPLSRTKTKKASSTSSLLQFDLKDWNLRKESPFSQPLVKQFAPKKMTQLVIKRLNTEMPADAIKTTVGGLQSVRAYRLPSPSGKTDYSSYSPTKSSNPKFFSTAVSGTKHRYTKSFKLF